ncbi:MAG: hypothetical protein IJ856_03860 [Candidatus Methanomethylophilaceae archaeon]|nr:hypothetical protein [Candidatus Methanomethylophilaceae archaeon]
MFSIKERCPRHLARNPRTGALTDAESFIGGVVAVTVPSGTPVPIDLSELVTTYRAGMLFHTRPS